MYNITQIAQQTGLSRPTVSKALKHPGQCRLSTLRAVWGVAGLPYRERMSLLGVKTPVSSAALELAEIKEKLKAIIADT